MLSSMAVLCSECGYENKAEFRFCGMCGAPLRAAKGAPAERSSGPAIALHGTDPAPESIDRRLAMSDPEPEPPRVARANQAPTSTLTTEPSRAGASEPPRRTIEGRPSPGRSHEQGLISGPSLLGLAQEPPSDAPTYLLEDEGSSSHRGLYLILVLIVIGGGIAGWHYRQNVVTIARKVWTGKANQASAPSSAETNPAAPTSASPSEVAPGSPNGNLPAAKPMTGVGDQPSQDQSAQNQQSAASSQAPPVTPAGASNNAASDSNQQPHSATTDSDSDEEAASNTSSNTANPEPPADAASAKPVPSEEAAKPSPARSSLKQTNNKSAESGSDAQEYLVTDGEKYLYGTGVPQNCGRAQKDLLSAAEHSNSHAASILGTMYATGHCASRDLPVSYRWFAKALHNDPNNARIEQDLEILWKQMTPEERKIAQSSD